MKLLARRIYLIGMMGSGKSYWAAKLGHYFRLPAYDLDRIIEERAGKNIRSIFEEEGEEVFRQMEADMLRNGVVTDSFILATGGGSPCFHDNIEFMKSNGTVVWMHPPLDEVVRRVSKSTDSRPVLQGKSSVFELTEHLQQLMDKRKHWYQQADVVIEDDSDVEKIAAKIALFQNK